jgi:hypothetical protein
LDFAGNAASLGAQVITARDIPQLKDALAKARKQTRTTVIVSETDPDKRAPGYESWWDVPVSEVSTMKSVKTARRNLSDRAALFVKFTRADFRRAAFRQHRQLAGGFELPPAPSKVLMIP